MLAKAKNTVDYDNIETQSVEFVQTNATTSQKIEKATESVVKNLLKDATKPDNKKTDALKKAAGNLAAKK